MASQWGRKESIIWPPHVPIMSYTALAGALLCTLFFIWQHLNFSMTPLQQSYITEYVRSQVGGTFKAHQSYRLVYLAGGKRTPRVALPADIVKGSSTLPNGTKVPVGLSDLAQLQGYTFVHRGAEQRLTDASMYRWLRFAIYDGKGMLQLFSICLIEGGICLVMMLYFTVPADVKRFKVLKYGRVLRGPVMMTPEEFNVAQPQPSLTVSGRMRTWWYAYLGKKVVKPVEGIGFKTTEMKEMMRVPPSKEAQHFLMIGDTGAGKTQLIMQIVRQIRDRGDVAIIYDPACEFAERFFDEKRGDWILNPLDVRCPYWSPTDEMARTAEAGAIAGSLYQPASNSGQNEFFYRTPAKIFAHLLKEGPDPHTLAEWMANESILQQKVKGTEMAFFIDRKAGPQAAGVLASLGLVAESFRMLPRKKDSTRSWNALDWSEKRQGWIFITSQVTEREIFRPLTSLWIDTLIMRLLERPRADQKKVWFVIDELASLQKLPQLHTAITESRKSKNPLVLGFQGRAQLEDIYGRIAEVMLSQPATKVFMKTTEARAAEWISETIGKVEIERLKETKFDGSRSGKNFTIDRQVEPLVMASEIGGLEDRHAYLKLGNNVARFDFDYIDLPAETPRLIARNSEYDELRFTRTPMGPLSPEEPEVKEEEAEDEVQKADGEHSTRPEEPKRAPVAGPVQQEIPQKKRLIPWPNQQAEALAHAGEKSRPAPETEHEAAQEALAMAALEEKSSKQIDLGY
jgi:type IV secretory pathway TraG/TraD family ATPase VirD4